MKASAAAVTSAVLRLAADPALRRRLIEGGYATARAHTLERQAAEMMRVTGAELPLALPVLEVA